MIATSTGIKLDHRDHHIARFTLPLVCALECHRTRTHLRRRGRRPCIPTEGATTSVVGRFQSDEALTLHFAFDLDRVQDPSLGPDARQKTTNMELRRMSFLAEGGLASVDHLSHDLGHARTRTYTHLRKKFQIASLLCF